MRWADRLTLAGGAVAHSPILAIVFVVIAGCVIGGAVEWVRTR